MSASFLPSSSSSSLSMIFYCMLVLLSSSFNINIIPTTLSFILVPTMQQTTKYTTIISSLVTEDDVLEAVTKAETLWNNALEARKTAQALSDRAEEEAEAAAQQATDITNKNNNNNNKPMSISLESIAEMDSVAKTSLDAGNMVSRAVEATKEADRLEALAEEALQQSQLQLQQHIVDFPDSELAQQQQEQQDDDDDEE